MSNPAGYKGNAPQGAVATLGSDRRPQGGGGVAVYNPLTDPAAYEWWDGRSGNGITVVGSGVDEWLGRIKSIDIGQSADSERPAYSAPIVSFDGVNDQLVSAAFTPAVAQPNAYFIGMKLNTWAINKFFFDGTNHNMNRFGTHTSGTDEVSLYAGGATGQNNPPSMPIGSWVVACVIFDGNDDSWIIFDDGTPVKVEPGTAPGTNNMTGMVLGSRLLDGWTHMDAQQLLMLDEHPSAAKITEVTNWMNSIMASAFLFVSGNPYLFDSGNPYYF